MEVERLLPDVVGRHGRERDAGELVGLAGGHGRDVPAELGGHVVGRGDLRAPGGQPGDLVGLEVIRVRMRDQDQVGRRRVGGGAPRVDVHGALAIAPSDRRLPEPGEALEHLEHPFVGSCR
jgi:hypothetical protein